MCGIIGVSGHPEAARLCYMGLYALQHRGQESAGIVAVDDEGVPRAHRGMGLVGEAFPESVLNELQGSLAVGHTRYATMGSTVLANAQPHLVNYHAGPLSLAHNGNLTNSGSIRRELVDKGSIFSGSSDSEVIVHLVARSEAPDPELQIRVALERVEGAYSLVMSVGHTLFAVVDARGFRPLFLGRLGDAAVVASETCAFDLLGATLIRELQPGEFVRVDHGKVQSLASLRPKPVSRCIFELIYFARPDSTIFGQSVDRVRRALGRQLAREQPVHNGEVVFSVPDSANAMALGYAETSGIKLEHGLIRNHYVGRTFIHPSQTLRVAKVRIKFNPVREVIEGRSVVVVDDSLVRGTTSKGLVQMIRAAGAREVHLRLASPPITGPCHYGIDTPTRSELIAAEQSEKAIASFLEVDSLGYLSQDGMHRAVGRQTRHCDACFSGAYPVVPGEDLLRDRHLNPVSVRTV